MSLKEGDIVKINENSPKYGIGGVWKLKGKIIEVDGNRVEVQWGKFSTTMKYNKDDLEKVK